MLELALIGIAVLICVIALLASPLVRVICKDSFVHPRNVCVWVKDGNGLRELKVGTDKFTGRES